MDKHLLEILCCPSTKVAVRMARQDELSALNRSIEKAGVNSNSGVPVSKSLTEALITEDGETIYRVDEGIPVMLVEEGISTRQIVDFPH